jgi:hypothetical protein
MFDWLSSERWDAYSQFGEDGVIDAIFAKIGTTNKWCLEVGAADGFFYSNTRRLYEKGWNAVLIESDRKKYIKLCENSPDAYCLNIFIEPEGENCLDAILDRLRSVPLLLDLIIIDIDGKDYEVWENLEKYAARVLVIEHAYMGSGERYGQATKEDIALLAESKGYTVVARTECNSICVPNRLVKGLEDDKT